MVFCEEQGTPLSIPNLTYRYFRQILIKVGLPCIRLYDLRHAVLRQNSIRLIRAISIR